jgi:hypothetical protein
MSTLKADTIQNTSGGAATLTEQSACKVWSYFNMSSTASINGSFNVSSLDDISTGFSRINATNALTNSTDLSVHVSSSSYHSIQNAGPTASAFRLGTYHSTNSEIDVGRNYISVWGDLA